MLDILYLPGWTLSCSNARFLVLPEALEIAVCKELCLISANYQDLNICKFGLGL